MTPPTDMNGKHHAAAPKNGSSLHDVDIKGEIHSARM
jgi:hypothetical protein